MSPERSTSAAKAGLESWTVILLAGSRPGGDPLSAHFGVSTKALIPLGGRAMIAHVLENLLSVPAVASVTILSQDPERIMSHADILPLLKDGRVSGAKSTDGIANSVASHLETLDQPWPVLLTTADHPLLDRPMIEHFMSESRQSEVAVGLVSRSTLSRIADPTKRTWLKFRDDAVSGANLFALRSPAVMEALRYWSSLERHRKQPWRMAAKLGPALLFNVLLRRLTLDEAFDRAGARLNVQAKAVRLPFPLAAVDVDKVSDHAQVETILAQRRT